MEHYYNYPGIESESYLEFTVSPHWYTKESIGWGRGGQTAPLPSAPCTSSAYSLPAPPCHIHLPSPASHNLCPSFHSPQSLSPPITSQSLPLLPFSPIYFQTLVKLYSLSRAWHVEVQPLQGHVAASVLLMGWVEPGRACSSTCSMPGGNVILPELEPTCAWQ